MFCMQKKDKKTTPTQRLMFYYWIRSLSSNTCTVYIPTQRLMFYCWSRSLSSNNCIYTYPEQLMVYCWSRSLSSNTCTVYTEYLPRGRFSTVGAGAYHPIIVYIPTQSSWWSTVGAGAYHPILVLYIQNTYPEVDVLLLEQELIIQ